MRTLVVTTVAVMLVSNAASALDGTLFADLLTEHTIAVDDIASTRVDYAALQTSAEWQRLLASLRDSDPTKLSSRDEKLAFWINAYNILAIDMVIRHYPVDSIRSIGSFFSPVWKRPAGEVGGRVYTLNEIEHDILRKMGEPRIHAAIVCASLSCPPLRREPYRAATLDAQLDDNVQRWLADPRKGLRVDRSNGTLQLSPIFEWFAEDFGPSPVPFVIAFVPAATKSWIQGRGNLLVIRYFDYDWSLNDTATAPDRNRVASRGRRASRLVVGSTAPVSGP